MSSGCSTIPRGNSPRRATPSSGRWRFWNIGCRPMEYDLRSARKGPLTLDITRTALMPAEGIRAPAGSFSFGIEEEYFLVDERTFHVVPVTPEPMFERAEAWTNGQA